MNSRCIATPHPNTLDGTVAALPQHTVITKPFHHCQAIHSIERTTGNEPRHTRPHGHHHFTSVMTPDFDQVPDTSR